MNVLGWLPVRADYFSSRQLNPFSLGIWRIQLPGAASEAKTAGNISVAQAVYIVEQGLNPGWLAKG